MAAPIVLDCDPGHDDAVAMLLAAASPAIDLRAITTVAGNGTLDKVTLNARRNLVTRGIDLEALIGRSFRVGDVECVGQRRCEPCAHLERLTAPGTLRELVHRGGLRADVVTGGTIAVGAQVTAAD